MNIKDFCDKQRELDTHISEKHKLGNPYAIYKRKKLVAALNVEIGEAANETRCFKYWSLKPCSTKEVVLEELADCMHFIFALWNYTGLNIEDGWLFLTNFFYMAEKAITEKTDEELCNIFNEMWVSVSQDDWFCVLLAICKVCVIKGYTPEELEEAYLKKHEENYERQATGY